MSKVECNGCTACCRGNQVVVLIEGVDDLSLSLGAIDDGKFAGRPVLPRKLNGDCAYLVDGSCSIYLERPLVCRKFDCRVSQLDGTADLGFDVIKAGLDRAHTLTKAERKAAVQRFVSSAYG